MVWRFKNKLKTIFGGVGPGIITGAADDDPSAITTYTIAGAYFGFKLLWLPVVIFPVLFIVQLLSAKLGKATGKGLAENIKQNYPKPVLFSSVLLLVSANIFQTGASLAGISSLMELITGINEFIWVLLFAIIIILSLSYFTYESLKKVFRWFVLALFAYIAAAIFSKPDWSSVFNHTIVPEISFNKKYITTMVGIIGSAVSPYIFFWQAVQMVEEQKTDENSHGIKNTKSDVFTGMLFACIIIYFIMLTAGATLHSTGTKNISSAGEIAAALEPVAGELAIYLFAAGFIGSAMLGIPALAGSVGFAFSESFKWKNATLQHKPKDSPRFYAVILAALVAGVFLYFTGLNPIDMLFISAVINGLLASPLVLMVILLTSNRKVMKEKKNSLILNIAGWLSLLFIASAAALFFII